MKKLFFICICLILLLSAASCKLFNESDDEETSHTYAEEWSYNDTHHWYACLDSGYEELKSEETKHTDSDEKILTQPTSNSAGVAEYTCSICGHTYQRVLYAPSEILTSPTIENETVYVGQMLGDIVLAGGEGSVEGEFSWSSPEEIITGSGEYEIIFTPTEGETYQALYTTIYITAKQLTVSVDIGENGKGSCEGIINVNYGSDLTVSFTANSGYIVDTVTVDGVECGCLTKYTLEDITASHEISVSFKESEQGFVLTCLSGTENAYTYDGTTLTFTEISEETVYAISGALDGSIVIDVGDTYKLDLEMHGFTLTSTQTNPITILSGDEVSIKAKNGYESFIYDNRDAIDTTDETLYSSAIYSIVDLELSGKGSLSVISTNNNGIHTKDDLQVKNLTLYVNCVDNALKGNDSVEITDANTTLIATGGDCIKTTNSHINEETLNQKGTVTISGGTHKLYSACDGIDSAYDTVIDNEATVLEIYTDKYSPYSKEVTTVSQSTYYLRYSSTSYKFSVKYSNSTTGEYEWVNASDSYETVSSSSGKPGGSSTYYYYTFAKLSGYDKITVYMYSSSQTQGQAESYYACTSEKSINESYDTVALSYKGSSLSVSWTSYSTSSSSGGVGGGFSEEGNTDKGEYSTKGIKAANEIIINAGTVTIKAYDDAIHANNDGGTLENGSAPLGNVTVNGGIIAVYSNDDGLHADGSLTISSGTVNVTNAYEGIEGAFITISGGDVSVISTDDGFNGTSTTGAAITICGGRVYIYCTGDGIDSNSTTSKGAILFSGGETVVICNSNGNSAIDSDGGYTQTGGKVLAIMASGGMTDESTNGNTTGMTTKSSISLSSEAYLTVSVSNELVVTVKMPCSLSAFVVYIGSSSATIASSTSSSSTLDSNGVLWNQSASWINLY